MDVKITDMKRCTLFQVKGRVDGSVAPELGSKLRKEIDAKNYKIVVNMKDVTYASSACLRELIGAWKTCRRWNRGDLRLAELNPNVDKVLDLTGLKSQFKVYPTEAEAVGSF
jgi:anti-sigma B factor antagonist